MKIGQIVRYHTGQGAEADAYYVAAVITMTPAEWVPGYRDADGEWHESPDVKQPKAHTVHLHVFPPPGVPAGQRDFTDIPHGTGHGCWSEVPS